MPGGAKQDGQRLPGDAFRLPGGCQRRLWDLPGRPQGTILEPKMAPNSMILLHFVLTPFFESFEAKFHVCLFCPTLRIYCNLQWNLHVFMFGPFLKNIPKPCKKSWKIGLKIIKNDPNTEKMLQQLLESQPKVIFEASKRDKKGNDEPKTCTKGVNKASRKAQVGRCTPPLHTVFHKQKVLSHAHTPSSEGWAD